MQKCTKSAKCARKIYVRVHFAKSEIAKWGFREKGKAGDGRGIEKGRKREPAGSPERKSNYLNN